MDRLLYPFSAVVGQDRVKEALLCLAVEPRIGGVLLCGEKGTAKSTLVRALGGLAGVRLMELPVSTSEDMLLGGVDLELAVRTGRRQFQPGLLARADGAILYADEVNLLPAALSSALLDTLESGVCRVEREGISYTCPARFSLVGTMNPEEGTLRPQLLDRFGLYVAVEGEREPEARKEVVRRTLDFEADPVGFRNRWARQEARLAETLAAARRILPQVAVGAAEEQEICLLAQQANAAGHRAELAILHTARALAALAGRTYLNREDLRRAAELALPHRKREGGEPPQERQSPPPREQQPDHTPESGEMPTDGSCSAAPPTPAGGHIPPAARRTGGVTGSAGTGGRDLRGAGPADWASRPLGPERQRAAQQDSVRHPAGPGGVRPHPAWKGGRSGHRRHAAGCRAPSAGPGRRRVRAGDSAVRSAGESAGEPRGRGYRVCGGCQRLYGGGKADEGGQRGSALAADGLLPAA